MDDRFLDVGGVRARYRTAGEAGAPVVLVHGLGGSVEIWERTMPALARDHRVYAVDLVGFGRSDKPDAAYTIADLARFVRDFLDAAGLLRATLVGHSLGGATVLRF